MEIWCIYESTRQCTGCLWGGRLAPPVLQSEEQILSCGVDVLYRCPPAQFLHLLTLVPDIWAHHSQLVCRGAGLLVKLLQAAREFGIWNNFFVEGHRGMLYDLCFFYKLSLPCEFNLSALPCFSVVMGTMLILSAWSYFSWIMLCALLWSPLLLWVNGGQVHLERGSWWLGVRKYRNFSSVGKKIEKDCGID